MCKRRGGGEVPGNLEDVFHSNLVGNIASTLGVQSVDFCGE